MPTNSTRSLIRSTELIAQNSKEPQRCGSFLYMLLLQQRGFGSAHSVGVRLLDVPLVQPWQAHGDALAAEAHAAFHQLFAA